MRHFLILSSLLLAFSCSYNNQTMDLNISPMGEFSEMAKGSNVFVTVFDYRDNTQIIGTKNYYNKSIEISTSTPLPDLLEASINKTLETHGFELDQNRRYIDLHIVKMDYNSKKGIFVGSSAGEVTIKAIISHFSEVNIPKQSLKTTITQRFLRKLSIYP